MIWANEKESATYTVVKQLCEPVCCSVAKQFRADRDEVWTHVTNVVVPRVYRHEKIDCLERYVRRSAKKEAIKFCTSNLSLGSSIKKIDEKIDHQNEVDAFINADAAEFLIRRSASLLRPELFRALLIFFDLEEGKLSGHDYKRKDEAIEILKRDPVLRKEFDCERN